MSVYTEAARKGASPYKIYTEDLRKSPLSDKFMREARIFKLSTLLAQGAYNNPAHNPLKQRSASGPYPHRGFAPRISWRFYTEAPKIDPKLIKLKNRGTNALIFQDFQELFIG